MPKNRAYYEGLDLDVLAAQVPKDATRSDSDAFGDMTFALLYRCDNEAFSAADLSSYLGPPDEVEQHSLGEIWKYKWTDYYGDTLYESETPFVIRDDRLRGVLREGKVLGGL